MTNIKSSKKRDIQSKKKHKYNSSYKSMLKTYIKKNLSAIYSKNKKKAEKNFIKTQKILDRQVSKKIIHKNKASRYKSILSIKINKM
ncbi:30S ribosomal protein S20 [Enterobacteriaceae bacterium ET-AT1-13]|nr:30S ribosomal protein S20 [Enterobacteriaceae bacterium ET-AT1-13]WGS66373.1 30S ribosomal protein S20 [Enterobacteriaceae bacterium Cmel17]WMC17399.1 MAG: 30S ribosomal protein S20 [Enterobacteriaceae bacterium Cmel21]WMC17605.1 MAG: 30S ribosomal protein S20 [Enterobacteriaceae bacterium PSmelAO3-2]WMC17810.1 MAG: 30S ribosomal protein S20 [Enterobacteriaceae bacterium PSmelAO3-1]WMC18013.1 MAG: 30S ribosomal protein S20 [Enterobacteriaceae bacterium PSmelAO1]